ncbi:MAG: UDP-glucose 4-epimerase GalE [Clostridia bacterium]
MKILLTGGAGFIGSHTAVELLENGFDIVIVDDLSNSSEVCIDRIKRLTGKNFPFYKVDVADEIAFSKVFEENSIDAAIHFAGFKAVGESVKKPLEYYKNNLNATMTLLTLMKRFGVKKLVFSSSATVYGVPETMPIYETAPRFCTNPYGWTKYMSEQIMMDFATAEPDFSIVLLRYFNPIGAHKSGLIGEDPEGIPNNLLPFITQVAIGKLNKLSVFGNDYDTKDGTGVRDYIHVVDLAKGHIAAINYANKNKGVLAVNLGTGRGYSVLEIVNAFVENTGMKVPYSIKGRRAGDIAMCYAATGLAKEKLNWEAELSIADMVKDSWRFQKNNPNGYGS